jgi:hypothetical protein
MRRQVDPRPYSLPHVCSLPRPEENERSRNKERRAAAPLGGPRCPGPRVPDPDAGGKGGWHRRGGERRENESGERRDERGSTLPFAPPSNRAPLLHSSIPSIPPSPLRPAAQFLLSTARSDHVTPSSLPKFGLFTCLLVEFIKISLSTSRIHKQFLISP